VLLPGDKHRWTVAIKHEAPDPEVNVALTQYRNIEEGADVSLCSIDQVKGDVGHRRGINEGRAGNGVGNRPSVAPLKKNADGLALAVRRAPADTDEIFESLGWRSSVTIGSTRKP